MSGGWHSFTTLESADPSKVRSIMSGPDAFPELKLTPRQVELILWQIVTDFGGGEMGTKPAEDEPHRRVVFYKGDSGYIDMAATEE
jgi:hypothetical protein